MCIYIYILCIVVHLDTITRYISIPYKGLRYSHRHSIYRTRDAVTTLFTQTFYL